MPYISPMNEIELLKVAHAVDATPPEHFDMKRWFCGSVGCAIGSYCVQNPQSRLKLVNRMSTYKYEPYLEVDGGTFFGYQAVSEFFLITQDDAEVLFSSNSYISRNPSRSVVSARIRKFVSETKLNPNFDSSTLL